MTLTLYLMAIKDARIKNNALEYIIIIRVCQGWISDTLLSSITDLISPLVLQPVYISKSDMTFIVLLCLVLIPKEPTGCSQL